MPCVRKYKVACKTLALLNCTPTGPKKSLLKGIELTALICIDVIYFKKITTLITNFSMI